MTENKNILEKQIADDLSAILKEAKEMGCTEVACFRHISLQNVETVVRALEEIQVYRTIGTVAQCQGAVEKMKPKKAIEYEDKFYGCANCGNPLMHKWEKYPTILVDKSQGLPYCLNCGQAIDWSDTPETENT